MAALIAPGRRRPVAGAAVVFAAVAIALAAWVWRGRATGPDTWVFQHQGSVFGPQSATSRSWWLWWSEPWISFAVPAVLTLVALLRREWRLAVFAALAPLVAIGVTELVGKPLVGRVFGPGVYLRGGFVLSGSYPSGHETGTVAWLVVAVVVAFRCSRSMRWRAVVIVLASWWAVAGAVGLTINFYHYATDTVGAIGSTTATVLAVALALDKMAERRGVSSPDGPARTRTVRAA